MTDKKRANWGSHIEFILTLVGFAVGLGNVWRFPYLCFKNGGGAFLIPYFICLAVMGIPLFYLELCFGQFASLGPVKIWIINPALKGLGYSMIIVSALISFYYNVVIAVCIHFFFASMTSKLPWSTCEDDSWASCYCRDSTMNKTDPDPWNNTRPECVKLFEKEPYNSNESKSPSEDYFSNRVLHLTSNLGETGGVSWELSLCLLLAWLIVFLVLTKGIKTLGKVVYVTAIFPYILLTALLIRGVTLDGHEGGIDFYLTPNITKLSEASVWSDAAVQIFYSLSACSGGLIAMASYNNFNNNVLRDSLLVPAINCLTSFYAGFVIFASLGFMAHTKGVSVDKVAQGGPGLAFIAYPEALAQMPVAPLWAILFFMMMMMLGFSSEFSIVETVLTGIIDEFPALKKTKLRTILFRACACTLGFLLGLPMTTGAGFHLLDLMDGATGGFPLLFVGFFETIAIVYIYGIWTFKKDIEMMIGKTTITFISFFYFLPMWCVLTPLCLLAVIVFKAIQYEPKSVTDADIFPAWGDVIYWGIVLFPVLFIPVWHILYYCIRGGCRAWLDVNSPKEKWGPALAENRTDGRYMKDFEPKLPYPPSKVYDRNIDLTEKDGVPEKNGIVATAETQVFENGGYDNSGKANQGFIHDEHM